MPSRNKRPVNPKRLSPWDRLTRATRKGHIHTPGPRRFKGGPRPDVQWRKAARRRYGSVRAALEAMGVKGGPR